MTTIDWEKGRNILVTAPPGEGKTTLVRRLAARLSDLEPAGFYTAEILREGRRTGFRLVGFDGQEEVLAHVDLELPRRVGKYGVDVRAMDALLARIQTRGRPLVIIDEIGKMECFSPTFRGMVHHWLESDAVVVATVAQRGLGLIEQVKGRDDCEVYVLRRDETEEMVELVAQRVRSAL